MATVEKCAICWDVDIIDYSSGEIQMPKKTLCGHTYHEICLNDWLKQVPSCPMCRQNPHAIPKISRLCSAILADNGDKLYDSISEEVADFLEDPEVLANINVVARGKRTLLGVAVENGKGAVAEALLKKGSKIDPLTFLQRGSIDTDSEMCRTLIAAMNAILSDEKQISEEEILPFGSYLFNKIGDEEVSIDLVLRELMQSEDYKGFLQALDLIDRIGVKAQDCDQTLLHLAVDMGEPCFVHLLLNFGFDPNVPGEEGETVLHKLMRLPPMEETRMVLEGLFEHGATIDARETEDDMTPLHIATILGQTEWIDALISQGADINAQTKEEMTALDYVLEDRRRYYGTFTFLEKIWNWNVPDQHSIISTWLRSKGAVAVTEGN